MKFNRSSELTKDNLISELFALFHPPAVFLGIWWNLPPLRLPLDPSSFEISAIGGMRCSRMNDRLDEDEVGRQQ